jgi:hypothetical protein
VPVAAPAGVSITSLLAAGTARVRYAVDHDIAIRVTRDQQRPDSGHTDRTQFPHPSHGHPCARACVTTIVATRRRRSISIPGRRFALGGGTAIAKPKRRLKIKIIIPNGPW